MENLSTGLKVWLWIVFVLNIIMTIVSLLAVVGASAIVATLGISGFYTVLLAISAILEIVLVVSIAMILFGKKKVGLYILIVVAVIGFVVSLISYGMVGQLTVVNIVKQVISSVILPVITFALAKKDIDNGILA